MFAEAHRSAPNAHEERKNEVIAELDKKIAVASQGNSNNNETAETDTRNQAQALFIETTKLQLMLPLILP